MFWIYGGALQWGTASQDLYDGSSMAATHNVIVVTANYRTNVFGFSNSPQIPAGQQNSGFLDQRLALDWVQRNIHAFGGDKTKVTIAGESAGGYAIKQLIALPPSPLNFRGAILESEGVALDMNGLTNWNTLVKSVGCDTASDQISCVRHVPADQIRDIQQSLPISFSPAYDGVTALLDVRQAFESKKAANVPMLFGTNRNEFRVFLTALGVTPDSPQSVEQPFLDQIAPGNTTLQNEIVHAYPAAIQASPYHLLSQIYTDLIFVCPLLKLTDLATENGYTSWRYLFDAQFPNTQLFADAGVYHFSELSEVFGTYPTSGATTQQIELSRYFQKTWAEFVKNPAGGPGWPKIGSNNDIELGSIGGGGSSGEKTISLYETDRQCPAFASLLANAPY